LAYFAQNLFRQRQSLRIPPFLILLEEAHQFVPEGKSEDFAKARAIFETIAREGRKFGASLCLVSQRPIRLSSTVLSQCNTHLLMRITNPYDLKHIQESSEGLDAKSVELITGLNVGEALMVGSSVNHPYFLKERAVITTKQIRNETYKRW
jgi:DNA helicase HerA-like ATPase